MNQVQQELHDFLSANFAVDIEANPIGVEESLITTGIVDSTGLLELVSFVEAQYGFDVPDEDLLPENFETIGRISAYIAARVGAGATTALG
jgi:acyl carrier protein